MGKMTINDQEIAWPDEQDDLVAAAVQKNSNVPGATTAEILKNWAIHEANSYRSSIINWIGEKAKNDVMGTILEDAEAAKDVAEDSAETVVTVKKVQAEPL